MDVLAQAQALVSAAIARARSSPTVAAAGLVTDAVRKAAGDKLRSRPWFRYGRLTGFLDPNPRVDPWDLYGLTPYRVGILMQMRTTHPVIASAYDFRANVVRGLKYEITPRCDDATLNQRLASAMVGELIRATPYLSLNAWIATLYDSVETYGFCLQENVVKDLGDRFELAPYFVPPFQIQQWNLAAGLELQNVLVTSGSDFQTLPANKVSWYGREYMRGNFWGYSGNRKLMSLYTAYVQDFQTYLDQQRLQKGVLYGQENGKGTSDTAYQNFLEWMTEFYNGKDFPILLDAGLELKHLKAENPQVARFKDMAEYYDRIMRETCMASLNNLGIEGVGARSLGSEYRISDGEKLTEHINGALEIINGNTHPNSNYLRLLTALLGFDPDTDTPMIVIADEIGQDHKAREDRLIALVNAGILSRADLSSESVEQIIESLGLESAAEEREGSDVTAAAGAPEAPTYDPPPDVQMAAAQALEQRRAAPVKVRDMQLLQRAKMLASGMPIDAVTLRKIQAFQSIRAAYASAAYPSVEAQEWGMNGGNPAQTWVATLLGDGNPYGIQAAE